MRPGTVLDEDLISFWSTHHRNPKRPQYVSPAYALMPSLIQRLVFRTSQEKDTMFQPVTYSYNSYGLQHSMLRIVPDGVVGLTHR